MPQGSPRGFARHLLVKQRLAHLIAGRIDGSSGTPSIQIGGSDLDASVVDNGVGDYIVTFAQAFARKPIVIATAVQSGGTAIVHVDDPSTSQFRVYCYDAAGAAIDVDVDFIVVGFDSADEI